MNSNYATDRTPVWSDADRSSPAFDPAEPLEPVPEGPILEDPAADATSSEEPGVTPGAAVASRARRRLSPFGPFVLAVALVSSAVASGTTFVVASVVGGHQPAATTASTGSSAALLSSTSGSLVDAIAKAKASVVTINVTESAAFGGQQVSGVGTGIVVGSNGIILTNRHVVSGASSIKVTLPDGRTLAGTVYGVSSSTDLAIVKVDASALTAATLGDSSALAVGQTVVAIGNPLGEYTDSVTAGIVSALNRSITVENESLSGLIQTDASVNGGNSGGPLLDAAGRVVGIVTASTSNAQGISFAIPISAAQSMIAAALANQPVA